MYWKVGPAKDWESATLLLGLEILALCRTRGPKHLLVPISLTRLGLDYPFPEEKVLAWLLCKLVVIQAQVQWDLSSVLVAVLEEARVSAL